MHTPEELTTASIDGLLTAAFALTHRMDAAKRGEGDSTAQTTGLRAQRDLIVAEIKRRATVTAATS